MPTGYTQQIIDGTVKTPKEFLHLCLRNFGVCVSMRDMPFDSQGDYTPYIKKFYQDSMDYHAKALENAKAEYERVINLSDDDFYEMYVERFSHNREYYQDTIDYHAKALENAKAEYERVINLSDDDFYKMYVERFSHNRENYQKRLDEIMNHNAQYQSFYDAIKNWDCSEEFNNIKKFALDQIDISKEDEDYYADELSKKMLTKEEFISGGKNEYEEDLLKNAISDISYHQKELDTEIKTMNNVLAFYESFRKEIEKL